MVTRPAIDVAATENTPPDITDVMVKPQGHSMADAYIFERLTTVLRDVFDDDDIVATPDLTAKKVKGWDSLGNVRLFLEIEKARFVRFGATEIGPLKNVAQLAELTPKKTQRTSP